VSETVTEIATAKRRIALHSQLVDFLADGDSAKKLFNERFRPEYLTEQEANASAVLNYAFDHLTRYGVPATKAELEHEFAGLTFEEPSCELDWLIDRFRTRYAKSQAEEILLNAGPKIRQDPLEGVRQLVRELGNVRDHTRRQNIMFRSDDAGIIMEDHWKALDAMGGRTGCSSGYYEIDQHFGGWKPNQLIFIVGRPKSTKSWQQVKSMVGAQKGGWTPVFFPLEMGKTEMFHRYACMVAGVSYSKFTHNNLSVKERVLMADKVDELSQIAPGYFLDPPRGERTIDNMVAMAKDVDADIIFIDQLKFIEPPRATDSRYYAIEMICEELKDGARHFPIVVSCQFNREAASLGEMADLSKIGLSDAIGQTGDVLLGLYQGKEMRQANVLEFGILDARAYEWASWELSVDLSINSNFRVVDVK